jgi:hypothetical protein
VSGASRRLLRKHPLVVERIKKVWAKRRALASNDLFVRETESLRKALDRALKTNRRELERFFKRYRFPVGPRVARIRRHLDGPPNTPLRKLLRRYIHHISTYGVYMILRKRDGRFKLRIFLPKRNKFHVHLVDNDLQPAAKVPEHMFDVDNFESETVGMPKHLEEHIKRGEAKFIRIDDRFFGSALSQLEALAFDPDRLTYVEHRAERPYVMLMIGENVDKKVIERQLNVITAFQREVYKVRKAGRPMDVGKLRRARNLSRKPGPAKEKAWTIMPHNAAQSAQNYFSTVKKKLR